jgi:predicted phage replisome organizer
MAEVKWIKITTNIFDDEKMKLIDSLPERDAVIVIWFKLLVTAGKVNDNGNVYVIKDMATTDEVLATIFNRPLNTVRLALETFTRFGMIEINNHVNISNWEKHQNVEGLEKIREQNRIRKQNERERKQNSIENIKENELSCDVSRDITQQNKKENKNKIEIKNIDNNNISEFENFWNVYNKKIDKDKCIKAFYKLNKEEIENIIEKAKLYAQSTPDIKFRKNPLTWLNGKCWNDEIVATKEGKEVKKVNYDDGVFQYDEKYKDM